MTTQTRLQENKRSDEKKANGKEGEQKGKYFCAFRKNILEVGEMKMRGIWKIM